MVSLEGKGSQMGHSHSFVTLEETQGNNHAHHGENASTERLIENQPPTTSLFESSDNISTIPTAWAAVFQSLIFVAFEVMIFILSDVLHTQFLGGIDPPFALLISIHVGVWLLVLLIDRYLHYHHRMLRTFGYLDFYTKTKDIRRMPVWILSIGNAVLLVIVSVLGRQKKYGGISLVHIFKIIVSVELGMALISTLIYLAKVIKFNLMKKLPDAFCQDVVEGFSVDMYTSPEIGYRDQNVLNDVLEKQAEMIRYLQQHNANLGKKIVDMVQQNNGH